MREKNPSQIGLEVELKCQYYLISQGFNVLVPLGNFLKYDLVIEKNNKFYTIQVKHSHSNNINSFSVNTKYDKRVDGKVIKEPYQPSDIDYFLTEYNGNFYMFPSFGTKETKFWFNDGLKKLKTKRYAQDYLAELTLKDL